MSDRIFAVIDPESARYARWMQVFGTDAVELEIIGASEAIVEGEGAAWFYRARVDALEPDQLNRLVDHLSRRWDLPGENVIGMLRGEHGLPIKADDVRICADPDEGRSYFQDRRIP